MNSSAFKVLVALDVASGLKVFRLTLLLSLLCLRPQSASRKSSASSQSSALIQTSVQSVEEEEEEEEVRAHKHTVDPQQRFAETAQSNKGQTEAWQRRRILGASQQTEAPASGASGPL